MLLKPVKKLKYLILKVFWGTTTISFKQDLIQQPKPFRFTTNLVKMFKKRNVLQACNEWVRKRESVKERERVRVRKKKKLIKTRNRNLIRDVVIFFSFDKRILFFSLSFNNWIFREAAKTFLSALYHHFLPIEERDTTCAFCDYRLTVQGCCAWPSDSYKLSPSGREVSHLYITFLIFRLHSRKLLSLNNTWTGDS